MGGALAGQGVERRRVEPRALRPRVGQRAEQEVLGEGGHVGQHHAVVVQQRLAQLAPLRDQILDEAVPDLAFAAGGRVGEAAGDFFQSRLPTPSRVAAEHVAEHFAALLRQHRQGAQQVAQAEVGGVAITGGQHADGGDVAPQRRAAHGQRGQGLGAGACRQQRPGIEQGLGIGARDQQKAQPVQGVAAQVVAAGAAAQIGVVDHRFHQHQHRLVGQTAGQAGQRHGQHIAFADRHQLLQVEHGFARVQRRVDGRRRVVGPKAVVDGVCAQPHQIAIGADAKARADAHAAIALQRHMQAGDQADAVQQHAAQARLVVEVVGHAVELAVREHLVRLEDGVVVSQRVEAADDLKRISHGACS